MEVLYDGRAAGSDARNLLKQKVWLSKGDNCKKQNGMHEQRVRRSLICKLPGQNRDADQATVISGTLFFSARKPRIASAIWDAVIPDKSFAAASRVCVNSRFHPALFRPRGKSWYAEAKLRT